jgi:hypothetical protein
MISDHGPEFAEASALIQSLEDHRFIDEAIEMARAAYEKYDPAVHKLVRRGTKVNEGEMTYNDFFRQETPDLFRYCRNVKSAIEVLIILTGQCT